MTILITYGIDSMDYNNLETYYGGLLLLTINPLNRGRYTNLFNHIHNRYLQNSLVNLSSYSLEVKKDSSNTNPIKNILDRMLLKVIHSNLLSVY